MKEILKQVMMEDASKKNQHIQEKIYPLQQNIIRSLTGELLSAALKYGYCSNAKFYKFKLTTGSKPVYVVDEPSKSLLVRATKLTQQ